MAKMVVIDGVNYEFSLDAYMSLQTLLKNKGVRVFDDAAIQRQRVSDIKTALGRHYTEVILYNHETGKLSPQKYNGYTVRWDDRDKINASIFKEWFDKLFRPVGLTLVATVVKQVNEDDVYSGVNELTDPYFNVLQDIDGLASVANFVVRDKDANLRLLFPTAWLGNRDDLLNGESSMAKVALAGVIYDGAIDTQNWRCAIVNAYKANNRAR